ncbi:hypothetical protein SAMN05216218_114117 [Halorientalis regularis]|uniref:Uncharacterized protein n=1 Tax=Halorientalis regularis TaxID=660518 RepID=A0A1G7R9S4_9EURY|nr:hypothetical protein SAMN05216218_114117 [Halorientalis regularis]
MTSSLSLFAMWSLVTVAGDATQDYAKALLSLDPITFIRGEYLAAHGVGYSILALYYLFKALWRSGLAAMRGHGESGSRAIAKLLSNSILSIIALITNFVILVGPAYLLWELLITADPVVLPHNLVYGFRTLVNMIINIISFLLIILVIWFFVEEFTSGKNQVFELEDFHQNHITKQTDTQGHKYVKIFGGSMSSSAMSAASRSSSNVSKRRFPRD